MFRFLRKVRFLSVPKDKFCIKWLQLDKFPLDRKAAINMDKKESLDLIPKLTEAISKKNPLESWNLYYALTRSKHAPFPGKNSVLEGNELLHKDLLILLKKFSKKRFRKLHGYMNWNAVSARLEYVLQSMRVNNVPLVSIKLFTTLIDFYSRNGSVNLMEFWHDKMMERFPQIKPETQRIVGNMMLFGYSNAHMINKTLQCYNSFAEIVPTNAITQGILLKMFYKSRNLYCAEKIFYLSDGNREKNGNPCIPEPDPLRPPPVIRFFQPENISDAHNIDFSLFPKEKNLDSEDLKKLYPWIISIEEALNSLPKKKVREQTKLNATSYSYLICINGKEKNIHRALDVTKRYFETFCSQDLESTKVIVEALVYALCRSGNTKLAQKLLSRLQDFHCELKTTTKMINHIIAGYMFEQKKKEAKTILQNLFENSTPKGFKTQQFHVPHLYKKTPISETDFCQPNYISYKIAHRLRRWFRFDKNLQKITNDFSYLAK